MLLLAPDRSLEMLFVSASEPKTAKNRLHLDVVPTDRGRDDEVQRLLGIGASLVDASGLRAFDDVHAMTMERGADLRVARPGLPHRADCCVWPSITDGFHPCSTLTSASRLQRWRGWVPPRGRARAAARRCVPLRPPARIEVRAV